MSELVMVERRENSVAVITVNRPQALNALNREVLNQLDSAIAGLENDKSVRVVVITGSGEKAFVAGADIAEMRDMTPLEAHSFSQHGQRIFSRIKRLDQVVIAAISGYALGGGCELAMACDLRVAAENARFGQPEINLGIIPGFGGTVRLARLVGPAKAREMVLTGAMVNAEEAYRIGLVNRVVPTGTTLQAAVEWAEELATKPPVAVAMAKAAMREGWDAPVDEAMAIEADRFARTFHTSDQKEGMSAHLEKRKAEFQGK